MTSYAGFIIVIVVIVRMLLEVINVFVDDSCYRQLSSLGGRRLSFIPYRDDEMFLNSSSFSQYDIYDFYEWGDTSYTDVYT